MHQRLFLVFAAATALSALAPGAHAAPERPLRFAIENRTGEALLSLSIGRAAGQDWRVVTLDRTPVAAGGRVTAKVDPPDPRCEYDVRALFQGGAVTELDGVKLCDLKAGALVLN